MESHLLFAINWLTLNSLITYLFMYMIFEFYKAGTICLTPQVNPMKSLVFFFVPVFGCPAWHVGS